MKKLIKTVSPILLILLISGAFPSVSAAFLQFSAITGLMEGYTALNDELRSIIPDEIEKLVSELAKIV